MADLLTEGYEQAIDWYPKGAWQRMPEHLLGFFGGGGSDIAPAVANAMDVDVDTNCRDAKSDGKHEVGSFATDARECQELVHIGGNFTGMIGEELLTNRQNVTGFGAIKADWVDELRYFVGTEIDHGLGGIGHGKKSWCGDCGGIVPCAQTQDSGNQHFEWPSSVHLVNQGLRQSNQRRL